MSNKNEQRVNSGKMVVEVREKHEEQRNPNSGLHWKDAKYPNYQRVRSI